MRFSKNAAVSLEGDRIYFQLLNRYLRVAQAKTEYTRRPLGCQAFRPSIFARASLCLRLGSDLWSVDDQRIDAPRSELERVRAGRDRLLDRCGPHAVDLHAAALNETARLGRRRDPSRLLDHFPERPPRGFGRQPLGVVELAGYWRGGRRIAAESCGADGLGLSHGGIAVDERRHLAREHALRLARLRRMPRHHLELGDLRQWQEREVTQEAHDVGVGRVQPELVHLVRGRLPRIEPHRARLRLAELRAVALGHERQREAVCGPAVDAANQLDAGGDVAPLVTAAELDRAVVQQHQRHEVVGLQHLIAEFGVGDAGSHSRPHRLAGQHRAQREVLADVAQEADDVELRQPRIIVGEDRGVRTSVEVEERSYLLLEPLGPLGDLLLGIQGALPRLAARIADEAGAAADEHDRPVAGQLHAAQWQERQQTPDLQAVGGRVEADVRGATPRAEMRVELVGGGDVRDQLTGAKIAQELRGHGRDDYRTGDNA